MICTALYKSTGFALRCLYIASQLVAFIPVPAEGSKKKRASDEESSVSSSVTSSTSTSVASSSADSDYSSTIDETRKDKTAPKRAPKEAERPSKVLYMRSYRRMSTQVWFVLLCQRRIQHLGRGAPQGIRGNEVPPEAAEWPANYTVMFSERKQNNSVNLSLQTAVWYLYMYDVSCIISCRIISMLAYQKPTYMEHLTVQNNYNNYPHMPIGKVWIYRLLFVFCVFVRLRISPPMIKLATSHFARRFFAIQGRNHKFFLNFAPQRPKIGRIGQFVRFWDHAHPHENITVEMRQCKRHGRDAPFVKFKHVAIYCAACGRRIGMCGYMSVPLT